MATMAPRAHTNGVFILMDLDFPFVPAFSRGHYTLTTYHNSCIVAK